MTDPKIILDGMIEKTKKLGKRGDWKKMTETFKYEHYETMEEVRKHIQKDEGHCVQQVAYSSFHDALTQINFTDKIVRSNL